MKRLAIAALVLGSLLSTACAEGASRPTDVSKLPPPGQSNVEDVAEETRVVQEPVGVKEAPALVSLEPVIDDPGTPLVDAKLILDAPTAYEHLMIRAGLPVGVRYGDLGYEGNNKNFRGPIDDQGLYRAGEETAADWRRYAAGVKRLVVLRDSLFSQQDHPVLQAPRAIMMPPSWVTVAVAEREAGRSFAPPFSAPLEDDAAWSALSSAEEMFGVFPPSDRLFTEATRSKGGATQADRARTLHARASMNSLAEAAQAMVLVAPYGPEFVAQAGAAQIAASDRRYFGADLRKRVIIPIFVENPNEHESRDEGKGMQVWGRELSAAAVERAGRTVYARRLQDGPLGIERYDLRSSDERQRAVELLVDLIPEGSRGHQVWLWVNGGSDGHGNGDPATPYIRSFRAQLASEDIEMSRVVLLSKPSVRPWGEAAKEILAAESTRYRDLGIPLSAQISTRNLRKLFRD